MSTSDIKFSVSIPAYKATFLSECIDSILSQTYTNFEIIIVNDASPYNLDEVVARYTDERINYYKNEVGFGAEHVVGNWNKCLEHANGDYVICMGDDDKLLPCCLEEYAKLISKYPDLNVYHALTEIIDENSNFSRMQEMRPEREGVYSMIYGRLFGNRLQYIGDWLFRTDWLKEKGGYVDIPMAWGSDDLTAYNAALGKGVANSQVPMFQYRVNSQTISNSGNTLIKFNSMMSTYKKIKELLELKSNDDLDEKYRLTCKAKIDDKIRTVKTSAVQKDMVSIGKIKGLAWWMSNSSSFNIRKSEIIKAFIKSINK